MHLNPDVQVIKDSESIINNLPKQKAPDPNITGEFYQELREKLH